MARLLVPSDFPTIAAAVAAAQPGDVIALESGYSGESAGVGVDDLTFDADAIFSTAARARTPSSSRAFPTARRPRPGAM